MKQKKITIIMAGILAAATVMTGCAEQNKTATQVDYTQSSQEKSGQTEKKQTDKGQTNKSTAGKKGNTSQTADGKKTGASDTSKNTGNMQTSDSETTDTTGNSAAGNDADNTDDSQNTDGDNNSSEDNGSTSDDGNQIDQRADQAMIYDSEGNGRLISQADDGNWYDSDGNCYGSWEDIGRAMDEDGVTDQNGNKYYWTWTAPDDVSDDASEEVRDPYDLYSWDPGTNSYIPFQAAESDCSPVGRGNGWYYYDENSGEYVPW